MSSPTRRKCLPGQIRNPASGRCVSRRGKIGQRLIGEKDSRRRSDKDRSPKRRKSHKESRRVYFRKTTKSLFDMLGPDVLRYKIKPFLGATNCEYETAKFGCKGVSSVYTADGTRVDCAGYCLKNCKPEELVHMFQPPTVARFSKADARNKSVKTVPWLHWEINFWKGFPIVTERTPLLSFKQQKDQQIKFISKGENRFVTANEASKILCKYIQDMNKRHLSFDYMTAYMAGTERFSEHFIGFDRSWLRPAKDWEIQHWVLRLKLQLQ